MNDAVTQVFKDAYGYENNKQAYDKVYTFIENEADLRGIKKGTKEYAEFLSFCFLQYGLACVMKEFD